jgi:small-conductance mechanosensitive channel
MRTLDLTPLLAILIGLFPAFAFAAEGDVEQKAATQEITRQSVPLKIANRTIITLRGPLAGYSSKERVESAEQHIESALASEHLPTASLEDHDYGTRVVLGDKVAFVVSRIDIDEEAGETTRVVAQEAARRLELALVELREQQTPRYLAVHSGFAALATVLYGTFVWLVYRAARWSSRRLAALAAQRSRKLVLSGVSFFDASHVFLLVRRLIKLGAWVVCLLLASAWLTYVLVQFPYTRPWGEQLEGKLLATFKGIVLAIADALPGLLLVVVIILIARGIIRFGQEFFDRVERGRLKLGWLDSDTAQPTRKIFNVVVWLFALAMAYPYLPGAQTEAFKGLSVLAGLMVTIGASSVVGQAFSGLILMFTKAYRHGDYVRIGDVEGTVMLLGTFATRIRTGLGEDITLPNSAATSSAIKNYSRSVTGTGYLVDTVVTIGYSVPWRQVHAMLEGAARQTAGIAAVPPAFVRQTALSDFYIEYRLVAYADVEDAAQRIDVLNRLHQNIQDAFNEHGVQIMSPHYMTNPAEPQVVAPKDWYADPARPPKER